MRQTQAQGRNPKHSPTAAASGPTASSPTAATEPASSPTAAIGPATSSARHQGARPNRTYPRLSPVQQDISQISTGYHNVMEIMGKTRVGFAQRLFELRSAKGVSAREMSLALGQGSGYISNLENRHNLPSMAQFFSICEYLGITPSAFFAFAAPAEGDLAELAVIAKTLAPEDLDLVLAIARKLHGRESSNGNR